jgi:hypothetical protein
MAAQEILSGAIIVSSCIDRIPRTITIRAEVLRCTPRPSSTGVFPGWSDTTGARVAAVASELVPDLLNGLVAGGTLALAKATYAAVQATRHGAVDAASHRVLVTQFWVDTARAESQVSGSTLDMKPGTSWDLTQSRYTRIALRAVGHLRNEGVATARLNFDPGPGVKLVSITRQRRLGAGPEVSERLDGMWVRRVCGAGASLASCRGLPVGLSLAGSAYICGRSRCFLSVRVCGWMCTRAVWWRVRSTRSAGS